MHFLNLSGIMSFLGSCHGLVALTCEVDLKSAMVPSPLRVHNTCLESRAQRHKFHKNCPLNTLCSFSNDFFGHLPLKKFTTWRQQCEHHSFENIDTQIHHLVLDEASNCSFQVVGMPTLFVSIPLHTY